MRLGTRWPWRKPLALAKVRLGTPGAPDGLVGERSSLPKAGARRSPYSRFGNRWPPGSPAAQPGRSELHENGKALAIIQAGWKKMRARVVRCHRPGCARRARFQED